MALAAEGREFVRRCIERCQGQGPWDTLCRQHRQATGRNGGSYGPPADFMWLETAFCERFLKALRWFGGMEHEWRGGARPEQAGCWVLLWSKDPQRLWWELRECLEHQTVQRGPQPEASADAIWLMPK